jgi:uncharacterized protein (TIGR03067 family)
VAARIAARAKVDASRRRRIERRGVRPAVEPNADWEQLDRESLIQHELARLPEKYRAPIVLCYLEGLTHEGAADQLSWPVGTVRGRLSRARDLLRARLTRRGIMASAAIACADSLTQSANGAVPAALRQATVRAAMRALSGQTLAAVASAQVAAWAEGASCSMTFCRWKAAAGVFLAIAALGSGLGLILAAASPPQTRPPEAKSAPPPTAQQDQAVRLRGMLQLKGTWSSPQIVADRTIGGVPQPPKPFKLIWSIDRDTITETDDDGFAWHTYRFTLDPGRTPKTIDLTLLNSGLELRGIYQLEGDTLTISHGLERPNGFEKGATQIPLTFQRESRTPAQLAPEIPNAPGCYWAMEPKGVPSSAATGVISYIVQKDPQGAMILTLAFVAKLNDGEANAEYRPVAVDDKKGRYLFEDGDAAWSTSATFRGIALSHSGYRLDPGRLPFDRVRRIGIEVVPAEVRRADETAASVHAFQEAREAGIELLPRPDVGKPFEFNLTAMDGTAIRSAAFKGKVVFIDIWASWRKPCMGKMAEIRALYERRRRDGLEVVGANFEDNRAETERLVKTLGLPWPQVFVPDDDRTRRLWADGPGLRGSPNLLLLDRDGILRWSGGPEGLEKRITDLLDVPR